MAELSPEQAAVGIYKEIEYFSSPGSNRNQKSPSFGKQQYSVKSAALTGQLMVK